jgi:hypothetical protein
MDHAISLSHVFCQALALPFAFASALAFGLASAFAAVLGAMVSQGSMRRSLRHLRLLSFL